ncbi:hypothetical protein ACSU1N_02030 [Thermogladius sp. 4427co]|uniref:hypothetical protein n=1 Tax=Thermogladius sp. 4427co TaxID=3450718 RepID=UPI003F78BEDC
MSSSYIPKGIHPRVFNKIVWELRSLGLWAERHSYSMRVMYRDKFVASLHFYPGYNIIEGRLYAESPGVNEYLAETLSNVLSKYLRDYKIVFRIIR